MAYNSDGYIMLDFAEVDFRQANQYIEGLYDRMVKVVGTNKFVIVINANNKTPLPSTVSITNNQYVIESCLYSFSVNSSDMLHITRHDPEVIPTAEDIIYDGSTSGLEAGNVQAAIDEVVDIIDDIGTPGNGTLTIKVNNVSAATFTANQATDSAVNIECATPSDLANYQPLLTAGDNISIDNNIISAVGFKYFNYTGTGTATNELTFPVKPKLFYITRTSAGQQYVTNLTSYGVEACIVFRGGTIAGSGGNIYTAFLTYNENKITLNGGSFSAVAMNDTGSSYTVYYI